MEKILIDSDVIIDFLRGHNERIRVIFERIEDKKIIPCVTLINIVELYSGGDIDEKNKIDILEELLSHFEIIDLTVDISKKASILRRKYNLGLADALITASCIKENIKLVTFNQKHFSKVKAINFYKI